MRKGYASHRPALSVLRTAVGLLLAACLLLPSCAPARTTEETGTGGGQTQEQTVSTGTEASSPDHTLAPTSAPTSAETPEPSPTVTPDPADCAHQPSPGGNYCLRCHTVIKKNEKGYKDMIYFACDDQTLTDAYRIALKDISGNIKNYKAGALRESVPFSGWRLARSVSNGGDELIPEQGYVFYLLDRAGAEKVLVNRKALPQATL